MMTIATQDARNVTLKRIGRTCGAWMVGAAALVLTGGQGCGIFVDPTCTGLNPPGIEIDVMDAGSGWFVPQSANPTGFLVSGRLRVRETMTEVDPDPDRTVLVGAHDRPGTYDVEIVAEGYEPWRATAIPVQMDHCGHAGTVKMTARLLPSPPKG